MNSLLREAGGVERLKRKVQDADKLHAEVEDENGLRATVDELQKCRKNIADNAAAYLESKRTAFGDETPLPPTNELFATNDDLESLVKRVFLSELALADSFDKLYSQFDVLDKKCKKRDEEIALEVKRADDWESRCQELMSKFEVVGKRVENKVTEVRELKHFIEKLLPEPR